MPKTAAQIVPLKTQLASVLTMLRFSDTTEAQANASTLTLQGAPQSPSALGVYEERVFDATAPTAGVGIYNVGSAFTGIAATPTLNAPTVSTTGGSLVQPGVLYAVFAYDSAQRVQRILFYSTTLANSLNTNSVTVTVSPNAMANVSNWVVVKLVWYAGSVNPTGIRHFSTTAGLSTSNWSFTDQYPGSGGNSVNFSTGSWSSGSGYSTLGFAPNPATTVTGSFTISGSTQSTGGYSTGMNIPVALTAYSAIGPTLPSATQAYSLGYNEAIATGPTPTLTAGTASGSLAANTYYYRVSATNSFGESLAGAEASVTLSGTGNIVVSWTAVPGATGYSIYRSTSANTEQLLASTAALTYTDSGSTNPATSIPYLAANSGTGPTMTASVSFSWPAVAGATGYRLFTGFGSSYATPGYYAAPVTTSLTQTLTGTETYAAGLILPTSNYSGNNVLRAGKLVVMDANAVLGKVGMVFAPVAGKSYRAFASNGSSGFYFASNTVVAATSNLQYMEFTFNTMGTAYMVAAGTYFIGVEGIDTTSFMTLYPAQASSSDVYGLFTSSAGTLTSATTGSYNYTTTPWLFQSGLPAPVISAFDLPMRITRRIQNSATALTANGALAGVATASNQVFLSTNYTYTTPVRAITPSWQAASGVLAGTNGQAFQLVEVSSDGGTTWSTLTNGTRFAFATAATQLMYRITITGAANTFLTTLTPGLAGTPTTGYLGTSGGTGYGGQMGTFDSGQPLLYVASRYSYGYDTYTAANGAGFNLGYGTIGYRGSLYGSTTTADVDVSATVLPAGASGHVGILARSSDGSAYGYYLAYTGNGTFGLYIFNNYSQGQGTLPAATATVNTGLALQRRTMRLVCTGSHIQGFLDGRLLIDTTDSTFPNGAYAGVAGSYGYVSNFAIGSAGTTVNAMEQFSAFIEV